jgi:hypothetical protein
LQHLTLNIVGKTSPNQCDGRLPRAKSRDARDAGKFPRDAFHGFLDGFRGNFKF